MRAIIIQDTDARALLAKLELVKLREGRFTTITNIANVQQTLEDMHRSFHFEVCRWLQEQGADVVQR